MRKRKKLLTKIAAGAMVLALCVSSMSSSIAATPPDNSVTYNVNPDPAVYSEGGPLFVATNFHIFAEDSASITSHCNGNIATKMLKQGSNSGSNKLYASQLPEYNYIRKFQDGSVVRFGPETQVVFGAETDVYLRQGAEIYVDMFDAAGNEASVQKMDITSNRVFTEKGSDDSQRFINFNEEFRKLSILSYNLAKETATATVSNNEINMSGLTGTNYVNVTPEQLNSGSAFIINNTNFTSDQAIVINVDLGTRTNYTVPFTQVLIKDTTGTSFGTGEDKGDYTGHGNVLWNFYGRDVDGNVITYTGEIMTCTEFKGTILAPDAVIRTAASNQDGNFIGREVHLGGGETHRWDFGGTLKSYNYGAATGSLNAVVTENDGTTPVANVEIYVYEKGDENGEPVARISTDATGTTTTVGSLPIGGEYTGIVKQIPVGYEIVENHTPADTLPNDEDKETINSTGLHTLNFVLKKTESEAPTQGYIKVVVVDKDTGSYVKGVTVNVVGDSTVENNPFTTDDFGVAKTGKLAVGTSYEVSISDVPTGYVVPASQSVTVSTKNPDELLFEIFKVADTTPKGSIQIKVYEAGTNQTKPVEGAVVSITEGSHVIKEVTVTTDENGVTEVVEKLPLDKTYTTTVISIPDGYSLVESARVQNPTLTTSEPDKVVIYELVKEKGSMQVIITDTSDQPIKGAKVDIIDNATGKVIATTTTDANGKTAEIYNLEIGGSYTAKVVEVPEGYEIVKADGETEEEAKTETGTIASKTEVLQLQFQIQKIPTGDLDVTVKEKDSTNKVQGAVVKVYDSSNECIRTVTTDSSGHFVVNDLPVGTYTVVTTEPAGYKELDDSAATKTAIVLQNGKAEVVYELEKIPTGNLDVTVKEKGTGNPVKDAVVEIYKVEGSTETLVYTEITDDDGNFVKNNIPTGEYKIVTTSPTGYKAPDDTNSPQTANVVVSPTATVVVELAKETGLLDVVVKYPNGTSVDNVKATVTGAGIGAPGTTVTTGGNTEVSNLTIGEKYFVEIDASTIPEYYTLITSTTDTNPREVSIPDKNKVTVVFEVKNTGILDITVRDEKTDAVIPGAVVQVVEKDNPDKVVADDLTTDPNGKVVVKDLDTGKYTIIVKEVPSGYNKPTENKDASVTAGSTTEETLKLNKPGNLYVIITDEKTGAVIPGATVEIKNDATGSVITRNTNDDGEITVTGLQPGNYTVTTTAVPKDYNIPGSQSAEVKSDDTTKVPLTVKKVPGKLVVTVTENKPDGLPIPGAVIVVKDSTDTEIYRGTTNSEGILNVPDDLYPEEYKIITESIPSTYDPALKPADTTATVVSGQTTQKDLLVPSTAVDNTVGKLIVTITDENTKLPIAGAEIELTYPDGTKETIITDSTGKFEKDKTAPGTYTITTVKVPTGYTAPGQQTATVVGGQTTQKDLVVAQGTTGTLVVVVTDVNGTPVSGVGITLTDINGTQVGDKATTGADGKTDPFTGLVLGETYKAVLDESTLTNYYVLNGTVNVKAENVANATTLYKIPFEVKKTGALEVTIKDKNTDEPIKGATVTITNKDTNEVVADKVITDADGKVTVSGLPGGNYTVTTNSVPDGYTAPDPQDMEVTVGDTATKELFVEKGSLQVQINDKNTGAAIPEATVVIKKPDGSVVATVVTDENGMTPVVKDLAIGTTYTIETTKVPSGYTAPTPTTQEIKSATTEVIKLQVGRDSGVNSTLGSLSVIITDKNTGKPIPGATVEITNSAGEVIKTVVTDDTGAFTVTDLKPDTYTVKTTKVPEGYTAPDTQKAEVKANARTDVHLYVVKGASSSQTPNTDKVVQTGDESNVQAVSILAVLACLGIVIVSIMRKREENLI